MEDVQNIFIVIAKKLFEDLSSPIANCHLITSEEIHLTDNGLTNLCKKNISNAFENVPFADQVYGLLGLVPAEILHVSGTGMGLLKHMFGCLDGLIGGEQNKKETKNPLMIYIVAYSSKQRDKANVTSHACPYVME